MKEEFTLLIADRNPHVRNFLGREIRAEGYRVRLAKNGREVLKWAYHHEPIDLIILDSDLPDAKDLDLLNRLEDRIPTLPLVIHGFPSDYTECETVLGTAVFVEKGGSSIETLKKIIFELLRKSHPKTSKASGAPKPLVGAP